MILLLVLLASMQQQPSMPKAKSTILLGAGVDLMMFSPDSKVVSAAQFSETAILGLDEQREVGRVPGMPLGYPSNDTVLLLTPDGLEVRGGEGWNSLLTSFDLPEERMTALAVDRHSDQFFMALRGGDDGVEFLGVSFSGQVRRYPVNLGCSQVDRLAFRRGIRSTLLVAACRAKPLLEVFSIKEESGRSSMIRLDQIYLEDVKDPGPAGFTKGLLMITQDSRFLVSSHFDHQLRAWRLDDGRRVELEPSTGKVVGLLEAPDEELLLELVAKGRQRTLRIRQMPGFVPIASLSGRFSLPYAMSLSNSGDLATTSYCPREESIQLPQGKTLTREKRQPCLQVYAWKDVLAAAGLR